MSDEKIVMCSFLLGQLTSKNREEFSRPFEIKKFMKEMKEMKEIEIKAYSAFMKTVMIRITFGKIPDLIPCFYHFFGNCNFNFFVILKNWVHSPFPKATKHQLKLAISAQ